MLNYYSKFKLLSPYLIISLISILLVFDKDLAEKISVLLIFVISTIFLKNFYFILLYLLLIVSVSIVVLNTHNVVDYNFYVFISTFYIPVSFLIFLDLFSKLESKDINFILLDKAFVLLILLVFLILLLLSDPFNSTFRFTAYFPSVLNFTGFAVISYIFSIMVFHNYGIFKVVLWVSYVVIGIASISKAILLTALVSLLVFLKNSNKIFFIFYFLFFILLVLYGVDFESNSNLNRISRYLNVFDDFDIYGIGLQAFPSISNKLNIDFFNSYESYFIQVILFSPIFFSIIILYYIGNSKLRFGPKYLFLLSPLFSGSLSTPYTMLTLILILMIIKNRALPNTLKNTSY